MFNKFLKSLIILIGLPVFAYAQNCDLSFTGKVQDLSTGKPISYANIYIQETEKGEVTDSLGYFNFSPICEGHYHISITHIGCEIQQLYLDIHHDTTITVYLDHNSQLLNEVVVQGQGGKITTQETQLLNSETIARNADKNLATMLEDISGVSVIKNGSGIAKPIVHGLYGNRLTILNNGIAQSGQQWGVDHSPEIDPLVANRITVVKGVGALEYQGSSLGSVVLVEPKKIPLEPHLHGEARYSFESNGLGNGLNLKMQQDSKHFAWRIVGTVKKSGDKHTNRYYLRNTGNHEANLALQLEKKWNSKWSTDVYFSSFNAKLGVLRGSHIGNTTDLEEALKRDIPYYTEETFSYRIDAPHQTVNHQLLKLHTIYQINENEQLNFTYAGQYNLRKEYDVRRGDRSDKPALSLKQFSNFIETKYKKKFTNNWDLSTGIQVNIIDNTNIPETDILPLIPDYLTLESGAFALLSKKLSKTTFELGGRYDFENRDVVAISKTVPRKLLRYNTTYHNVSALAGATHSFNKDWKISYNIGFASRNPEVNELYSNGLHQGVSGIEEGDANLVKEVSLKNTLSIRGDINDRFFIEGLFYHQSINNYIYLDPQDEIRLTIRGAFPVFQYEQTDARIAGFDLASTIQASEKFNITAKYSFIDGYDKSNKWPLIYMPSNNLSTELNYQVPELFNFQNLGFNLNAKYVFEQKNLNADQDFVAPPDAYYLIGLKVSAEKQLRRTKIKMYLRVENLLNTSYRDYLNRQRYFADDQGINVVFGINASF